MIENLEIKITKIGRGVFSKKEIKPNQTIEISPIIRIPQSQIELIDKTDIHNYYFAMPDKSIGLALGYGSLYNHSYTPNAKYSEDNENNQFIFTCLKKINPGDEITVNYNGNPNDKSKLWFEVK
jgi:SET domain-containing protein